MSDLLNARAGCGDTGGEFGDAARAIGQVRGESPEPAVGGQAVVDHAAKDREIDVASAEQEHHVPAFEL